MARESTQHKLDRVRPPRVQITYDVEIGDAIVEKELPFVMGVMGDYSGHPEEPLPRFKDRKFVDIDRDNFDAVMKGMKPRLAMRVENKLTNDGSLMPVELNFRKMSDFSPEAVARQVDPLRQLLDMRARLSELRSKLYGNEKLETMLQDVIQNTEKLTQLARETGHDGGEKGGDKGDDAA